MKTKAGVHYLANRSNDTAYFAANAGETHRVDRAEPIGSKQSQRRRPRLFGWLTLMCLVFGSIQGRCAEPTNAVTVTHVQSRGKHISLNQSVAVTVRNLADWAKQSGNDVTKLVPFLNGRQLKGLYPEEVHLTDNTLVFGLQILPANQDIWEDLLRRPTAYRPVSFSVGPEDQSPFETVYRGNNKLIFTIVAPSAGVASFVVIVFIGACLVILSLKTNMIRDSGPGPISPGLRPYNLGRTQMACWFFLVISSYLLIWLTTGNLDTITASLLGLIGISAGTALGDVMIDDSKASAQVAQLDALNAEKTAIESRLSEIQSGLAAIQARAASTPPAPALTDLAVQTGLNTERTEKQTRLQQILQTLQRTGSPLAANKSEGFLKDVLSDGAGYSFHRFQIFAWTLALMIVFVVSVYQQLKMPEFSATLLGLMGISAGTYIGFKFPEQ